jgi:hypothetical protein
MSTDIDLEFGMSVRANSADVERSGWCCYPLVQLLMNGNDLA